MFLVRRQILNNVETTVTSIVARINNPAVHPSLWQIDYLDLCYDQNPFFGVEALVVGNEIAVYGYDVSFFPGKSIVIKLSLATLLSAPNGSYIGNQAQYLSNSYTWKPGLTGPDVWDTEITSVAGFSVRYNARIQKWQVIRIDGFYASNDPGQPVQVQMLVSSFGPFGAPGPVRWEDRKNIYHFPELTWGDPLFKSNAKCYGVREYEGFSSNPDYKILFTYTNNFAELAPNIPPPELFTNYDYCRIKSNEVDSPY